MKHTILILLALAAALLAGCTTGVQESPDPGIFRVTLTVNDADSTLVILGDTARSSRIDRYTVTAAGGRLYRGDNYVDLFLTPTIDRITGSTINLLQRQWPDGRLVGANDPFEIQRSQTKPVTYTIFEWHTPPGTFDNFQFSLIGIEVFVAIPRQFNNPLQLPDSTSAVMNFPETITINEGQVTQLDLVIDPYKSIRRFRDTYIFERKISVARITYRGTKR
ncbi:MAG: hypothetical protein ACM3Q4_00105 [Acidobacteriota bacterium]